MRHHYTHRERLVNTRSTYPGYAPTSTLPVTRPRDSRLRLVGHHAVELDDPQVIHLARDGEDPRQLEAEAIELGERLRQGRHARVGRPRRELGLQGEDRREAPPAAADDL